MEITQYLVLPRATLPYILLQRTGYVIPFKGFFGRMGTIFPYLSASFQSLLFTSRITKAYADDIAREFVMLKPYLPPSAEAILDIGCGMAGIDVPLYRHFGAPKIFLLDATQKDPIHYGFKPRAAFYNSLNAARDLLIKNGVPEKDINLFVATENFDVPKVKFDLIFSLIAWGFHFPIETYLNNVYNALKPGGVLIIDVRANTQGEDILKAKFGNSIAIYEGKNRRILCRKQTA
jgi:SAM-dependent methyltransferase